MNSKYRNKRGWSRPLRQCSADRMGAPRSNSARGSFDEEPPLLPGDGSPRHGKRVRGLAQCRNPCISIISGWLREGDSDVSRPGALIKVSAAFALTSVTFFTTSASGQSPAAQPISTVAASDSNAPLALTDPASMLPHSRHPLPHPRQATSDIEMESSSGKLPRR